MDTLKDEVKSPQETAVLENTIELIHRLDVNTKIVDED
jgi:hypothetical protein